MEQHILTIQTTNENGPQSQEMMSGIVRTLCKKVDVEGALVQASAFPTIGFKADFGRAVPLGEPPDSRKGQGSKAVLP
jgi:hypothetical protein